VAVVTTVRREVRGRRVAAVAAAAIVLAACSAPDLTPAAGGDDPAPASTEGDDDPLAGDPFADRPPALDAPPPPSPPPPTACASDDLAAMDEVIAGQLAAFAADDWETALDFASTDFREGIDPDTFALLIEEGFPVAADAVEHRSGTCLTRGTGAAEVRVEVVAVGGERADLVYLLVDEDGWRIAGAAPLDADLPEATEV
jgi:hypothetical protein